MGTRMKRVKEIVGDHFYGLCLRDAIVGIGIEKLMVAAHNYAAGTTAWTLTDYENQAVVLSMTNAGGAVNAIAKPYAGKPLIVVNSSGQTVTVKPTAAAGVACATGTIIFLIANIAGTDFVQVGLNTTTISGATIDNSIIGGTTPAAGHFTTLGASGAVALAGTTFGVYGATPVAQRSGAYQAQCGQTPVSSGGAAYGFTTSTQGNALISLVNEIQAVLSTQGWMKGSA